MKLTKTAAVIALVLAAAAAAGCSTSAANSAVRATARPLPSPFTITARYTAASLGLNNPDSLAVGPDGNLYLTDLSQRVTVVSPAGTVLRRWGKPGSGPGQFRFIPADTSTPAETEGKIAVGPDGEVYVSDSGNGRVQVFTPQGRFTRQFGSFGSGKGQFLRTFDLAVDKAGNVYVADDQAGTLAQFSPAGEVIWQIGGGASGDPDLSGHFHLASIDAHGRLVVVNDDQQRILYIDDGGHKVDAFSPDYPSELACEATVDAAGNTYVSFGCGGQSGPTLVFDRAHRLIARWLGATYSLLRSPVFGPHGEVFALATDGSILKLHITLPGA
jgi:DNA-binding beta-propeller fold protein YncE